jgi:hypothetical protein
MKRLLAFLLAALIIVGCSSEPPDPDATDWCYIYDFTTGFTEFNVVHGTVLNLLGFIPDGENVISFNYQYDRFVEPLYVIPTITRAPTIAGDVTIDAAGIVYGIATSGQAVLPGAVDSASPTFEQTEIGTAGNTINVTIQGSQAIILKRLEIRGMGSNPFERNDCDNSPYNPTEEPTIGTPSPIPTLTPSLTASPVPTATGTPSPTQTLTSTPTPTNTPSGLWSCTFDFTVAENGFASVSPWGSWSGGTGYTPGDGTFAAPTLTGIRSIIVEETVTSSSWTSVTMTFDLTKGHFDPTTPVGVIFLNGSIVQSVAEGSITDGTDKTLTWNGSMTVTAVQLQVVTSHDQSDPITYSGDSTLKSVVITGNDPNPFTPTAGLTCDEPTPTPSPTPNDATNTAAAQTATAASATPTAVVTATQTVTPSDGYLCVYNFLDNAGGFTATNGTFDESGDGWLGATVGGSNALQINKTVGSTQINSITLTWIVEIPAATLIISSPYGPTSSINVTAGTRIQSQSTVKTGVTSLAFSGGGSAVTGKRLRLTRAEIRGSGARPNGATCQNPTPSPDASRTPLPSVTPRPASRTPIPPPPSFMTATGSATVEGTPSGTPTPNGTQTAIVALTGTPMNKQAASEAAGGLSGAGGVGGGVGNLFGDWLGQAGLAVGGLITSFNETPPEPIPGLPLCMSNPQASDWCALIYILEWTILADGTPGEIIIPFLLIVMNIYIVIYFARWILRIVRRGETITSVG